MDGLQHTVRIYGGHLGWSAEATEQLSVLVVEDDPECARIVERFLAGRFDVDVSYDAHEALAIFEEGDYPVVISDYYMPRLDGVDFLDAVREMNPSVLCILMTAYPDMDVMTRAVNRANIFRFIPKPIQLPLLADTLDQASQMVTSRRENERLWQIVNQQAEALRHSNAGLEAAVEARTAELKEAQAALVQAAKLSAMGEMASSIVHEVRQPLTAMSGLLQLLEEDVEAGRMPDLELVADARKAAELQRSIIQRIGRFSKRSETEHQRISPAAPLRDALQLLDGRLRAYEVKVSLDSEGLEVMADPVRLQQVFVNLIGNAIDAAEKRVRVSLQPSSEGGTRVSVEDDGPGVPEANRRTIFEAFFTTKGEQGTGLGLAISRSLVADMGGQLRVGDSPLGGAHFQVTLPPA